MTIKTRPDINLVLNPIPTTRAFSNDTGRLSLGNRIGTIATEASTGVRRRKPKGWLPPTPYTFTRRDWRAAVGTAINMPSGFPTSNGQYFIGVCGTLPGDGITRFSLSNQIDPVLPESSAIADGGLRNAALIAARNKLKTTNVDLGVAYGERKQTTGLVTETAKNIAQAFRHLSRGNTRRAMDQLGISSSHGQPRGSNIPKKWLELQYAWRPGLSDVYGSVDSLAKRNRDDWRVTARATRSSTTKVVTESGVNSVTWSVVTVNVYRSAFVRIDVVPQNELLISLSSLGITNPLNVAWERVPYSFVVDWFIPIGSYLDNLDAMLGYTCRGYSNSLLVRADWTSTGIGKRAFASSKIENFWTGGKSLVYLDREAGISTPFPTPPSFKDPRSLGHMANALALLAGAFGRRG